MSLRGYNTMRMVLSTMMVLLAMTSLPEMTSSTYVVETVIYVDKLAQTSWKKVTEDDVNRTDIATEIRSMMFEVNEIYKGLKKDHDIDIRIHLKELVLLNQDVTSPAVDGTAQAQYTAQRFQIYLRDFQTRKYDVALLLTGSVIYGAGVSRSMKGFSMGYAGICYYLDSAAVITMESIPKTVYVIAHEMAHVMGAYHDGDGQGKECDAKKNYLMVAQKALTASRYKFSACTAQSLKATLGQRGICLNDQQDTKDANVPRYGALMSVDSLCKRYYGSKAYFGRKYYKYAQGYGDNVCLKVVCMGHAKKTGKFGGFYMPSPDGLYCGKNKQCVRGKCVVTSQGLPSMADSCPYGDQPSINVKGKLFTCGDITAAQCSNDFYRNACCKTCMGK